MIRKYATDEGIMHKCKEDIPGMWIALTNPDRIECETISQRYNIDIADIRAALDEEESSRIEINDDYTMVLFDIPAAEIRHKQEAYTTIPLGIIWNEDIFITICSIQTPILEYFMNSALKGVSTKKQVRFCYQIILKTCALYQSYLRIMDKRRVEFEERISSSTEDSDIINLHELESTLVYFDTSLRANRLVLEKLVRYGKIKKYPDDEELIEDVIVENQQAIEMTQIYRDIIRGTRELMASVMDNRLNNVMKYLAAVTIVMAIPTIISGLYGMNVNTEWMPFANVPFGFEIICFITAIIAVITIFVLKKRKML